MSRKLLTKHDLIGSGPVQYIHTPGAEKGHVSLSLRVDYSEAPVPPHYYVADYFYAKRLGFRVLLVFGKFDEASKELRNKLEVYIPISTFLRQVQRTSREFHETIRKSSERWHFKAATAGPPDVELDKTQGKTQTVQSNNVLMAFVDTECMIDFFYISPRELHFNPPKKKDIDIQALVRVMIDPPMMLGLLNECEELAKDLEQEFPIEELHDEDEVESK